MRTTLSFLLLPRAPPPISPEVPPPAAPIAAPVPGTAGHRTHRRADRRTGSAAEQTTARGTAADADLVGIVPALVEVALVLRLVDALHVDDRIGAARRQHRRAQQCQNQPQTRIGLPPSAATAG